MFGDSFSGWMGWSTALLKNPSRDDLVSFLFQASFCATAATIVSGAVAERIRFTGHLFIVVMLSLLIYPVFGHWAWGGSGENQGWLQQLGFIDFAGSTVVHSVGGWTASAGVLLLGPRMGFREGTFIPSNLNMYTLGGFFSSSLGGLDSMGAVSLLLMAPFLGCC